ncbi:MAG TPA: hypothetical protein VLL54_02850 [Pyrinomonadaceae bacterium]|nr:hypothetical protein [Pyrinomonadaceae bacterium]
MNILGALLALIPGMILGVLLIANLINVLGWNILSLSVLTLLPPGINLAINNLLVIPGIVSWAGLLAVLFVLILVTLLAYWSAVAGSPLPTPPGLVTAGVSERLGRGVLVGLCTGLNYVFLLALIGIFPGGVVVAHVLAGINLLACLIPTSNNPTYQVVLAYTGLFLPMNFPINLLGWVAGGINSAAAALGTPVTVFGEWPRASAVMYGGVVHGCFRTMFNLSNFIIAHPTMARRAPWVDPGTQLAALCPPATAASTRWDSVDGIVFHEGSHTLNVAAFGWIYHLIGAADEWSPMPWSPGGALGANAHAELAAESGVRRAGRNWIDMWTPSAAAAATGNVGAVPIVTPTAGPGVVVAPSAFVPAGAPSIMVPAPVIACERNRTVALDSTGSSDADGFPTPLGRLWRLRQIPNASAVTIGTPNAVTLNFAPDVGGIYNIDFLITDGGNGGPAPGSNDPLPITIDVLSATIIPPTNPMAVGTTSGFAGGGNTLTAATPLPAQFAWIVRAAPAASALLGFTGSTQGFMLTPDVAGDYEIELTVSQDVVPAAGGGPVTLSDTARLTVTV